MRKIFFAGLILAFFVSKAFAGETDKIFPAAEKPAGKMFLGEKLRFEVRYLGMAVGEATSEVKELVKIDGREAYRVEVQVRSRPILDWIYKVRDTHQTYIDAEHFHSLRYEKKISEGRYRADERMEYDQEVHVGRYHSLKDQSRKEMLIPKHVQDQISCAYWLRLQVLKPESEILIPVNADEKNWDLQVLTHSVQEMKLDGVGVFQALEIEPIVLFEGFFVRRGKVRGWISMDERHIPLLMKVKVPVLGEVTANLAEYVPGNRS